MPGKNTNPETHARPVNLRIRDDIRAVIDRAAKIRGKTRSDFMIDAAFRAAEEALLDLTLVKLDRETYRQFAEILDKPPSGSGFERLMSVRAPWKS